MCEFAGRELTKFLQLVRSKFQIKRQLQGGGASASSLAARGVGGTLRVDGIGFARSEEDLSLRVFQPRLGGTGAIGRVPWESEQLRDAHILV